MLFCFTNIWSNYCKRLLGLIADTFVDPFAHITIRENELFSTSGNSLDFYSVKGATALDFRAENDTNFQSLENNSIDLYSSFKSLYLVIEKIRLKIQLKMMMNGEI